MLTRLQSQLAQLSRSERRVGEWILAHPDEALRQDTRALAARIEVSQPTLVRFARSLGCSGFAEFRLKLAQELQAAPEAAPATLATIAASAGIDELCRGVFGFSAQALLQVRDALDRDSLRQAIRLLDKAARVSFFGFGNGISVAHDAQRRFMRLEMQVAAHTDPHAQALAAGRMRRGDVLVLVSHSGRAPELLPAVDRVRAAGASAIAITTSASPLRAHADVSLCVDVPDSGDAMTPATAQLAQLALLDLLVVGVAAQRSTRIVKRARRALDGRG